MVACAMHGAEEQEREQEDTSYLHVQASAETTAPSRQPVRRVHGLTMPDLRRTVRHHIRHSLNHHLFKPRQCAVNPLKMLF